MASRKSPTPKPELPAGAAPSRARRPAVRRPKLAAASSAPPEVAPGDTEVPPAATEVSSAERIRMRAYFLHLERKGRPGDPVGDWLRAEQEVVVDAEAQG